MAAAVTAPAVPMILSGIMNLFDAAVADYRKFYAHSLRSGAVDQAYVEQRVSEYADGLRLEIGNKYAKIWSTSGGQRSIYGFICLKDTGKFKRGDILKAASWAGPARNFARGNVLRGELGNVRWTGVM